MSFNYKRIADSFSLAAETYDEAAVLQKQVGEQLLSILNNISISPEVIIDLGSGTGKWSQKLALFFPNSTVFSLDFAYKMLQYANQNYPAHNINVLCGDAHVLPFQNTCCDLIFSNLMFQWSSNYHTLFQEINRILKPNGLIIFSTLGPRTLIELQHCWEKVDRLPYMLSFISKNALIMKIKQEKLSIVSFKQKIHFRFFSKAIDLMKELKKIGAHNLERNRSPGLMTKNKLQRILDTYESFRNSKGLFPATYEVYLVIAKK